MTQPTGLLAQPMQHRRLVKRRRADGESTSSTDSITDTATSDTSTGTRTRKHHDHTRTRDVVTATSTNADGLVSTSTSTARVAQSSADAAASAARKAAAAQAAATQHRNVEIGVICGVVGGLLLIFGALGVLIWLRRRKEARQRAEAATAEAIAREKEDEMDAVRLDDELYYRTQYGAGGNKRETRLVYGQSGRAEAKADVGHRGEAGWNYANYLVHGLESDEHSPPLYR